MDKQRIPPVLLNLKKVVPIAQEQQCDDIVVTALAFEVYEEGSIITFLISSAPNALHAAVRFGKAKFEVILRDHLGQLLAYSSAECGGIGDRFGFRGRTVCGLYWHPMPEIIEVAIAIPEMRWTPAKLDLALPDSDHVPDKSETILGPWTFTISL